MDRRIFLSYTWEDQAFVEAFFHELHAWNVSAWMDRHSIPLGAHIRDNVRSGVNNADIIVILLSSHGYNALAKSGSRGFCDEVRDIVARCERPSVGKPVQVVIADLVGFSNDDVAKVELLRRFAGDNRLQARDDYAVFAREATSPTWQSVRHFVTDALGGTLSVFPRADVLSRQSNAYLLSWAVAGASDAIESAPGSDLFFKAARPLVPLGAENGRATLQMQFVHGQHPEGDGNWWAAGAGFDHDSRDYWRPINLTRYQTMAFEARGIPAATQSGTLPLLLLARLETDDASGNDGSLHHSTSWTRPPLRLTQYFRDQSIDLDESFEWTKGAWAGNVATPDRANVLQITWGCDSSIPAQSGQIDVRNVRLLARP